MIFFLLWLTSLSMTISTHIHLAANDMILFFFYDWVIFHCIYVSHLLYPLLCWWTQCIKNFFKFIFGCAGSSLLLELFRSCSKPGLLFVAGGRLLAAEGRLQGVGFSGCGTQSQYWWRAGLVAPWHVESSWARDWTWVPCICRLILVHCATREVWLNAF